MRLVANGRGAWLRATSRVAELPKSLMISRGRPLCGPSTNLALLPPCSRTSGYATRTLFRSPAFTLTAAVTLALGIGATTLMFSVVNAVLLRDLPFADPDRLVVLSSLNRQQDIRQIRASALDFADWRSQSTSFDAMAGHIGTGLTFSGDSNPELVTGQLVTADFFRVLGVAPLVGRTLAADDFTAGRHHVIVLAHGIWQRRFGGDRTVIGHSTIVNGEPYTIVGVMPPGFSFPDTRYQLWSPLPTTATADLPPINRASHYLQVVARLRREVPLDRARADLDRIAAALAKQYPDSDADLGIRAEPLGAQRVAGVRTTLLVLLGAVGFVVLIACANVTNLLLARATGRQREVAIRVALGAGRFRLARQFLVEAVVLYGLGAAGALAFSAWGLDAGKALNPGNVPRLGEASIDARVLTVTLLISLGTAILFSLAPALHAARSDGGEALKAGGRSGAAGDARQRLRSMLVVAEVALSVVLLVGAALALRSFVKLTQVHPGFDVDDQVTFTAVMQTSQYADAARMIAFTRAIDDQLSAAPGILHVGGTTHLPFSGQNVENGFRVDGYVVPPGGNPPVAGMRGVTGGYFAALGIPLKAGRAFTDADREGSMPVAIVNEAFARRYFGGQDPIGRRLVEFGGDPWRTVVGVIGNVKHSGPEGEARPEVDLPYAQLDPGFMNTWSRGVAFVVRGTMPSAALVPVIRARMGAVAPSMPLTSVQPLSALAADVVSQPRFRTVLLGAFALLALVLAAVGVFGVLSYFVTQRTQEIGVRMALGAQPADVIRLVVGRGVGLSAAGIVLGLIAAVPLTRLMQQLLFEVTPTDAPSFAAVAAVLLAVAGTASYVPARRATRVDPMTALRQE
jgi:putative ABC transport system permease protein